MKNKKLLALLLAVVLLLSQFSMLGVVSAETVALTGRDTPFDFGINIHNSKYSAYEKLYDVVFDAQALGANLVRTNCETNSYDVGFAELAAEHGIDDVMFIKYLKANICDEDGNIKSPEEIDYIAIYDNFYSTALALKEHAKYIQIDNEMDISFLADKNYGGESASQYDDVTALAIAIYVANKAIHDAAPEIKTVLNFSWTHYGFFEALKAIKIDTDKYTVATDSSTNTAYADWDVIGADIYSVMGTVYETLFPTVKEKFGKQIIVTEVGLCPKNALAEDGSVEYYENAAWLETFARYCYADNNIIGFIPYELYDEPAYSTNGYNSQSHYGLIDKNGNKKPTYDIICNLYGVIGERAERTTITSPTLNNVNTLKNTLLNGTVEGVIPRVYDTNVIETETLTATDFTQGNFIEFDFYVEDADALKRALLRDNLKLRVALSDEVKEEIKEGNTVQTIRQVYNNTLDGNTALVDGWNHIVLSRGDFYDAENKASTQIFGYNAVTKLELKVITDSGTYTELSGMKIAIANICSTIDKIATAPAYPDYAEVDICKDGVTHTWGDEYNWTQDQLVLNSTANPIDISSVDQVEFDIYVEDNEAFQAAATAAYYRFVIGSGDSKGVNRNAYEFADQITKNGWNHIVINLTKKISNDGTFNSTCLKWLYIAHFNGAGKINPIGGEMVRIANVCGTLSDIRRVPAYTGHANDILIVADSGAKNWGNNYNNINDNSLTTLDPVVNLSNADQIEFDMYIENYQDYANKQLDFNLSSSANRWNNRVRSSFNAQVTQEGWNHIVLPKSSFVSAGTGAIDYTSVKHFYITCESTAARTTKAVYRISNVYGTLFEINRVPEYPEYASAEIWKEGKTYTFSKSNKLLINDMRNNPVNISTADQIEFDLYVEDCDSFIEEKGYPRFVISSNSGDTGYTADRYAYEFVSQVTKDGWNHIVIDLTKKWHSDGKFDKTSLKWVYIVLWGGGLTDDYSVKVRIANVYGTVEGGIVIPTDVMTDKVDFIGATLNKVDFDGDQVIVAEFETSKDISTTKMIELDVYMNSDVSETISMYLVDIDGGQVEYTFKDMTKGWNHLAVRISDLTVSEDCEDIDFENIMWIMLLGTEGTSAYVSNFYAADYIEGDANRDGKLDLKDLVRAKKLSVGLTKAGNVLAISGNDYKINGTDLIDAQEIILASLFK